MYFYLLLWGHLPWEPSCHSLRKSENKPRQGDPVEKPYVGVLSQQPCWDLSQEPAQTKYMSVDTQMISALSHLGAPGL